MQGSGIPELVEWGEGVYSTSIFSSELAALIFRVVLSTKHVHILNLLPLNFGIQIPGCTLSYP